MYIVEDIRAVVFSASRYVACLAHRNTRSRRKNLDITPASFVDRRLSNHIEQCVSGESGSTSGWFRISPETTTGGRLWRWTFKPISGVFRYLTKAVVTSVRSLFPCTFCHDACRKRNLNLPSSSTWRKNKLRLAPDFVVMTSPGPSKIPRLLGSWQRLLTKSQL